MKKIVLFGDSLLARCGKGEIEKIESSLAGSYDCYNCAVGGWDSRDLLKKVEYITRLQPDAFLISVGMNDLAPWKQVPLTEFKENVIELVQRLKRLGPKISFLLPPPVTEQLQSGQTPRRNSTLIKYTKVLEEICEANECTFIDISHRMNDDDGGSFHLGDGVHLAPKAYEVIFSNLNEALA